MKKEALVPLSSSAVPLTLTLYQTSSRPVKAKRSSNSTHQSSMIFCVLVITTTRCLPLMRLFCCRTSCRHLSSGSFIRLRSIIMLLDCLSASRMLFSIVRLLLPYGDLISHSNPLKRMSGVGMCPVGINSTSSPVHDKIVATLNSCGCTSAFFGTVICPIFCFLDFLISPLYHSQGEKTTPEKTEIEHKISTSIFTP